MGRAHMTMVGNVEAVKEESAASARRSGGNTTDCLRTKAERLCEFLSSMSLFFLGCFQKCPGITPLRWGGTLKAAVQDRSRPSAWLNRVVDGISETKKRRKKHETLQ